MGNKSSKPTKMNKEIRDEKVLKIGLGLGKGDMSLEGNFHLGWVRKANKKYTQPKVSVEINGGIQDNDDGNEESGERP